MFLKTFKVTQINAKEGDPITIAASFSAEDLELGHYELICLSLQGFFPTDLRFEVIEAGGTRIVVPEKDGAARQDKVVWYDLQGRKLKANPTQPGVFIVGGNKIVVR